MDVVGAISSIVQLIDYSSQVLLRVKEYTDRKSGPNVFSNIANQLPLLIADLEQLKRESEVVSSIPQNTRQALSTTLEGCRPEIENLKGLIEDMIPEVDATRYQRVKKALLSIYKEKKIIASWKEVQSYRSALAHHFILFSNPASTTEAKLPKIYDVPPFHVPYFVKRPGLFCRILDSFRCPSPSLSLVTVLLGMGGQGKTQLALEYCRHSRETGKFAAIFWVEASSRKAALRGMEAIGRKLAPGRLFDDKHPAVAFVRETLSNSEGKWLIVFDNFDNPSEFTDLQQFFPQSTGGSILVTSRHRSSKYLGRSIQIEFMEESEGLELLISSLDIADNELPLAKQIVALLCFLPLAIDQARAYIEKRQLPLKHFLLEFERQKAQILKETPQLSVYRRRLSDSDQETSLGVFTTWEMSLSLVGQDQSRARKLIDVLTLLAFFYPANIGERYFPDYLEGSGNGNTSSPMAIFLSHGRWDSHEFLSAISEIQMLSLARFSRLNSGELTISLHSLVSDWLKMRLDTSQYAMFLSNALLHLQAYVDRHRAEDVEFIEFAESQKVLLHLDRTSREMERCPDSEQMCDIRFSYAQFYYDCGQFSVAERLWAEALSGYEKMLDPEHEKTLKTLNKLGRLCSARGRLREAEGMLELALEGCIKTTGPDHPCMLDTLHNLGNTYFNQGRLSEAEAKHIQALLGKEKVLGRDHISTIYTVNCLGNVYLVQGRLEEADLMYGRALRGKQKTLGVDHPHTLAGMENLGHLYRTQGRLAEASKMFDQALEGYERVLGPDHVSMFNILCNSGSVHCLQGHLTEAGKRLERALMGREKLLGDNHLDTLVTIDEIGLLRVEQGRLEEGEDMFKRALIGFYREFGQEDHHLTLTVVHHLGCLYKRQGKLQDATTCLKDAVAGFEKLFGADDHRTKAARFTLDEISTAKLGPI